MTDPTKQHEHRLPVRVHLEKWTERDEIERLDTVEADAHDVIAELPADTRKALAEAALAEDTSQDWIYERLVTLGLLAPHDGPFTVDLDPLAELLEKSPSALDSVPSRPKRVITAGSPLAAPMSVEQALTDSDDDGFLTAMVRVPFDDMMDAHASRNDEWDEHDLLASKVSPLPPYGSTYKVVGLVPVEGLQPDLLVLFTNCVAEAAAHYNAPVSLFEDEA